MHSKRQVAVAERRDQLVSFERIFMFVGMSSWRQLRKEIYKTSFFRPAADENEQQPTFCQPHGMSHRTKTGIHRGAFQHDAIK